MAGATTGKAQLRAALPRERRKPAGHPLGRLRPWIGGIAALGALACGTGQATPANDGGGKNRPVHVDSARPRDQALARFREGLPEPEGLEGGEPSADALVRRFVQALERADTSGLPGLALTRAEFAYFFYPYSAESRPPYDLDPALSWFLVQGASRKGLARVLHDLGGRPFDFAGWHCQEPQPFGSGRIWHGCVVNRLSAQGDTIAESLFGSILEFRGRYKFVSLANRR
jgi:hypothetical protein